METTSKNIDQYIARLGDWRGDRLSGFRKLINGLETGLNEEWKWNSPVWALKGKNIISVGAFKHHIKIVFFQGAVLADPHGLFNSGLEAKNSRTIDLKEGDPIDEDALEQLIRSAAS